MDYYIIIGDIYDPFYAITLTKYMHIIRIIHDVHDRCLSHSTGSTARQLIETIRTIRTIAVMLELDGLLMPITLGRPVAGRDIEIF